MHKITERLFIGDDSDCNYRLDTKETSENQTATLHACKTCHQKALGYKGNLNSRDRFYLVYEMPDNLFLNIVDMDTPLLHRYMSILTKAALDFIQKKIKDSSVIIHCNVGESRAPSLALLYLAKRYKNISITSTENLISNDNFYSARQDFLKLFPTYKPSNGISTYMENHWEEII